MKIVKSYKLFLEELNMRPEIDLFSAQIDKRIF
jgi:hypothetical protein